MRELCQCGCPETPVTIQKQVYRYNAGVSSNIPTPPAYTPNDRGIVPDDPSLPATCYPISTDGSGTVYSWNVELQSWK